MIWVLTVFIIIFTIIVEIFTTMFMLTGLSHTKSKFQVISMLTSTGFTTKESETIMLDPRRRKYAQVLIVLGYCATVTIVSMLITSINASRKWWEYIIAILILIFFALIINNKSIRKRIDPKIQNIGSKFIYGKEENYLIVLESLDEKIVGKIKLYHVPNDLENKTIEEMQINHTHGIQILGIERKRRTLKNVTKDDMLKNDDLIVVYGSKSDIEKALNISRTTDK